MVLDVLVLGPVKVLADGTDCPVGGDKQRALLVRLVMARGRALAPERLIAELWGDFPPRDPPHALQARISRLRSALPVDIELANGGYRLDPTTTRTDASRFEELREDGGWLLEDGALAQAAERFHAALALWRGPAFGGLYGIAALQAEAARLEKLRASALTDRIDIDLALGHCAMVVPELSALVEEHPFSERHWGQLMAAMYGSGQEQEALEVFAQVRALFADRLGVEPSGELGQLHMQILQKRLPETLLRLPMARPILAASPADVKDELQSGARATTTSNHPDAVAALLRRDGALILTGQPGIGKTHLLRAMETRFGSQHCLAPLLKASTVSRAVPLGVFIGTAGSTPEGRGSPAALVDFFGRHRSTTVLLVDNVEMLDLASLFVVTQLIRTSRVPTILTARDLTAAPAEIQALYDSGELTEVVIEPLTGADAREVVTRIVGAPLTPDSLHRVLELAQGNPLHLREIVAGSLDAGRLVETEHGWELRGPPATTPRLAQLVGARFSRLDDECLEAAAKVAIAGEYPVDALRETERRALARTNVVEVADAGWLRLTRPLDEEILRSRCSSLLWSDLTREVMGELRSEVASGRPSAQRRAHTLALDLGESIDVEATIAIAEHALGAFDERLALRAAEAVVVAEPHAVHGYRIGGLAASGLGMHEEAGEQFRTARQLAVTAEETAAVALGWARHLGLQRHDATAAIDVIDEALGHTLDDPEATAHLQRDRLRWAVVAGQGSDDSGAPTEARDTPTAQGLITVAMYGVITGPLRDANTVLARLRRMPDELISRVPGGASLIELTEIMALSNTGDVVATRRRLRRMIDRAASHAPETLGVPEYALGFTELLAGDAERAFLIAQSAVDHLEWRDTAGLLPAAQALLGAAAQATGRTAESQSCFGAVIQSAANDPKVVMLRAWSAAWSASVEGRRGLAARRLVDAAQWLLTLQHTYFAGMLAHCAVRVGECLPDAVAVLDDARKVGGGGLLHILARHGAATLAGDDAALDVIAREARELGLATTAADTWLSLARASSSGPRPPREAGQQFSADRLRKDNPGMALWTKPQQRPMKYLDSALAATITTRPVHPPREEV